MATKHYHYLLYAQACLIIGISACFLLTPEIFVTQSGMSHFGVSSLTIIPFTLGITLAGGLSLIATERQPVPKPEELPLSIVRVFAVLLLLTMASTYPFEVNSVLGTIHLVIASILFVYTTFFSGWIVFRICPTLFCKIVLVMQIMALLSATMSWGDRFHILLATQVLVFILFEVIFWRGIITLIRNS